MGEMERLEPRHLDEVLAWTLPGRRVAFTGRGASAILAILASAARS